jgi:hypothetical protein
MGPSKQMPSTLNRRSDGEARDELLQIGGDPGPLLRRRRVGPGIARGLELGGSSSPA